jgi:hypothetical protein
MKHHLVAAAAAATVAVGSSALPLRLGPGPVETAALAAHRPVSRCSPAQTHAELTYSACVSATDIRPPQTVLNVYGRVRKTTGSATAFTFALRMVVNGGGTERGGTESIAAGEPMNVGTTSFEVEDCGTLTAQAELRVGTGPVTSVTFDGCDGLVAVS